jgi:hypothetical protein
MSVQAGAIGNNIRKAESDESEALNISPADHGLATISMVGRESILAIDSHSSRLGNENYARPCEVTTV